MSTEEAVVVRDWDGLWELQEIDDWSALTLLGALSADPRCLDELLRAWKRYRPEPADLQPLFAPAGGEPSRPWFLLDLPRQQVLAGAGAEMPESPASYQLEEGQSLDIPAAWINFPPAWQLKSAADWRECRAPLPPPEEPIDARRVLFGRPLAEGLANRALQFFRGPDAPDRFVNWDPYGPEIPDEDHSTAKHWYDLGVRAHADWLLTARDDLDGRDPRWFLHHQRDWVDRELEHCQQQWSREQAAPRPLDRDTFAYRFGPMGRNEVIVYFDLCRELLLTASRRLAERPKIRHRRLARLLQKRSEQWLGEPLHPGSATAAEIIDNERRRLPQAFTGPYLDCDCPLCRMEASGELGISFEMFDGHHLELDEEFAFSLFATRDEWEEFQTDLQAPRDFASPPRIGPPIADGQPLESESVWTNSFVSEAIRQSPVMSLIAVATRLAELVGDLKRADCDAEVKKLNQAFDDYRSADCDLAMTRVRQSRLVEVLEEVASAQPQFTGKVADLQSQLDERTRRLASAEP